MARKLEISAADFLPTVKTLPALEAASKGCRGCHLYKIGTQTVFGAGSKRSVMFVGEQPGDVEDKTGEPFVGPAGRLLDQVLESVGIERDAVYVTNVVKHFKWEPRGKRRIHKKPNSMEIAACRPWLDSEIEVIKPKVLVCLGATAAQALLGRSFKVTEQRGKWVESPLASYVMATVHPSSLLRAPDEDARREGMELFRRDLARVADLLKRETLAA